MPIGCSVDLSSQRTSADGQDRGFGYRCNCTVAGCHQDAISATILATMLLTCLGMKDSTIAG